MLKNIATEVNIRLLLIFVLLSSQIFAERKPEKLIIIAVDGFPGYYFDKNSSMREAMPTLVQLSEASIFTDKLVSVNPTLTFPAFTSLITGVEPAEHKIVSNHPILKPPHTTSKWNWYTSKIGVKTLWDFAQEQQKVVANLFWPVSVGADIQYNIPQIYHFKSDADLDLVRKYSNKESYDFLVNSGIIIREGNSDSQRLKAGSKIFNTYKPDLLFIYTTEIDTVHHQFGPYSDQAFEKVANFDQALNQFIIETRILEDRTVNLLLVSDHGFMKYEGACYPNVIMKKYKWINPVRRGYPYIFQAHAGLAYLRMQSKKSRVTEKRLRKLKALITRKCPGIEILYKGEKFEKLKSQIDKDTPMIILSKGKTALLGNLNYRYMYRKHAQFYTHGFLAEDRKMQGFGLLFTLHKPEEEIQYLTGYFMTLCRILEINCEKGQPR